ncbi:hypothetical protein LINPERPRIM_LOCUS19811 [Linum perenne]
MQLPRWRNVLILKNSLIPALSQSKITTASIHSTPGLCGRWSNNGKSNHVRFAVRQKRADTKKALKHLLFNNGSSGLSQDERLWNFGAEDRNTTDRKRHPKSANRRSHSAQPKRKFRRRDSCDEADSDDPESTFQAKFGNKWYTWSFNSSTSRGSKSESTHWTWRNLNDEERGNAKPESDEEEPPIVIGSCSDRRTLGLPLSGPLQIEEVKTAFRVSALKWHPDRHEGPSQAMAAEKFKLCVAAYKSLCSVLS